MSCLGKTADWERDNAAAVYEQGRAFVEVSEGNTSKLSQGQKDRFVALCWVAQIYRHIPDPKPSYVADWDDLPARRRETYAHIFEQIEDAS